MIPTFSLCLHRPLPMVRSLQTANADQVDRLGIVIVPQLVAGEENAGSEWVHTAVAYGSTAVPPRVARAAGLLLGRNYAIETLGGLGTRAGGCPNAPNGLWGLNGEGRGPLNRQRESASTH